MPSESGIRAGFSGGPISLDGMAVSVEAVGIVPAVIVAFELEELGASGVSAGKAKSEHGGFAAGVGEADGFGGRNHAAEALGGFGFRGCGGGEVRAFIHSARHGFDYLRVRVALDGCAERHHEVDIFVAIEIPDVGTAAFLEDYRAIFEDGFATRRGVNSFDQGLLSAVEPFAGFCAVCGGHVGNVNSLTAKFAENRKGREEDPSCNFVSFVVSQTRASTTKDTKVQEGILSLLCPRRRLLMLLLS